MLGCCRRFLPYPVDVCYFFTAAHEMRLYAKHYLAGPGLLPEATSHYSLHCMPRFFLQIVGPILTILWKLLVFSRSHEKGCTIRRTGEALFSQCFGRSHSPNRLLYFFSKLYKWVIPHPFFNWKGSTKPMYLWSTHYPVSFREQLQY